MSIITEPLGFISMWITALLGAAVKSVGKGAGSLAMLFCMFAFAYYVLRELYVRLVLKRKILTVIQESGWGVKIISLLRRYHPYFGLLALLALIVHGYLMWGVMAHFNIKGRISTGLVAIAAFALVALSGTLLKAFKTKRLLLGRVHLYLAILFLVAVLFHVKTKIVLF